MPVVNYVRGRGTSPSRIFLAIPTGSGDISSVCESSIVRSLQKLSEEGIAYDYCTESMNCHVDDARNSLVRQFLSTDCTDLVFIDADVGWDENDLISLIKFDCDVVAGVYPKKQDDEDYPVHFFPGELVVNDGLLEVMGAPTGFMRIRRHVLEKMVESHKPRGFVGQGSDLVYYPVFERLIEDGHRWSGDYAFCLKWRKMGGKIHAAPDMHLSHEGKKTWHGCLSRFLRDKNGITDKGIVRIVEKLKNGTAENKDFVELYGLWGNSYAASPELLYTLYKFAKGTVIETGCGLSTIVMAAAGAKIHALEHEFDWYDKVSRVLKDCGLEAEIHYCKLKKYEVSIWYELPELPERFDLAVCDGPQRKYGRKELFNLKFDKLIADDCESVTGEIRAWAGDREIHIFGETRKFAMVL